MDQLLLNFQLVALGIVTILNFFAGLYVFFKNLKSTLNRIFLFFASSITLWCAATFLSIYYYSNVGIYDLSDKFTYLFALFIALSFYLFTISYPYKSRSFSSLPIIIFGFLTLLFGFIAFFTNLFVITTYISDGQTIIEHNTLTYILYSVLIIIPFIIGMYELWIKMKHGDGIYKQHFLTLMILVGSSIVLSLIFDLLLSGFSNYSYIIIGPLSSVLMIFAIMRMIISKE